MVQRPAVFVTLELGQSLCEARGVWVGVRTSWQLSFSHATRMFQSVVHPPENTTKWAMYEYQPFGSLRHLVLLDAGSSKSKDWHWLAALCLQDDT